MEYPVEEAKKIIDELSNLIFEVSERLDMNKEQYISFIFAVAMRNIAVNLKGIACHSSPEEAIMIRDTFIAELKKLILTKAKTND